jgi:Cu/Ag efflux protein CusF
VKHTLIATLFAVSLTLPVASFAADDHASHQMGQAPAAADAQMVEGLVKKVDKSAGKVTLSHGPLVNLDMPAMTMVFRVKDAGWLDQMKAGDKIRFMADNVNGALTVVHFEITK